VLFAGKPGRFAVEPFPANLETLSLNRAIWYFFASLRFRVR
jgi:hypothetical protein